MTTNTYSDNSSEPFSRKTTRKTYERAANENDQRAKGTVESDEFLDEYFGEDRGSLNQAIWFRDLPVQHPNNEEKQYDTPEKAYKKLVFDAQFYVGDWEKVMEIVKSSPYDTQF